MLFRSFQTHLENLTRASHRIAEALYQQQSGGGAADAAGAGAQGGASGSGGQAGGEDVIDAEYIDVDENK